MSFLTTANGRIFIYLIYAAGTYVEVLQPIRFKGCGTLFLEARFPFYAPCPTLPPQLHDYRIQVLGKCIFYRAKQSSKFN